MAGKVTYLHGTHPTRVGTWAVPLKIGDAERKEIETALGRALTDAEKVSIEYELSKIDSWRTQSPTDGITAQTIKRTLTGMSKLTGTEAEDAYENCDIYSRGCIQESLISYVKADGSDLLYPSGELISRAATHALTSLSKSVGGRPAKGYQKMLADYAVNCWHVLSGKGDKAHATDNSTMSPLARFGTALFSAVESYSFDAASAAKLIREAIKRKNP